MTTKMSCCLKPVTCCWSRDSAKCVFCGCFVFPSCLGKKKIVILKIITINATQQKQREGKKITKQLIKVTRQKSNKNKEKIGRGDDDDEHEVGGKMSHKELVRRLLR